MSELPPPRRLDKASPWPFAGMIGLACVGFLVGAGVLVMPGYAVAVLAVVWLVAVVLAVRWWTPHPVWLVWLPVGLAVLWVAAVLLSAR